MVPAEERRKLAVPSRPLVAYNAQGRAAIGEGKDTGLTTFLIGLAILAIGGFAYGRVCERVMAPTDDPTPATARCDGVDFVPMKKWRNSLIELLNIAGTGPILGPIQGALFGPVAFITIRGKRPRISCRRRSR